MAVRGLVVEKIGLPEQDDESTENIDTNNLGKDVCFSFYLHNIFGHVKDVQFVCGITADLTDSAVLGEQLHGFWNAAPGGDLLDVTELVFYSHFIKKNMHDEITFSNYSY